MTVVVLAIFVLWYLGDGLAECALLIDRYERARGGMDDHPPGRGRHGAWSARCCRRRTRWLEELNKSIFGRKVTSKRSLIFHSWVTLSSTLLGFAMGTIWASCWRSASFM